MKKLLLFCAAAIMALSANAYTVTYDLTGCTGDDEYNVTTVDENDVDIDLYFTIEEGYTWTGVTYEIKVGDNVWVEDEDYMTEIMEVAGEYNLYIVPILEIDNNVTITITCKPLSISYPTEFTPATFEDVTVGSNGVFYDPAIQLGNNGWLNGSFLFSTFYDNTYGDYYSDIVVSSLVNPTMAADYSNPVSYLYAPTATPDGSNFAAWNQNYYGIAPVKMGEARTLSGMYVNNTSALINYIKTTPTFNTTFAIQVTGKNAGVQTGTVTITLADYTNGNTQLVEDWFWQDLSTLGAVDELNFLTICTDYMAPQYFCFDNLGGTQIVTGCQNLTNAPEAEKILMNGQVIIRRGEHLYNAAGQIIR